jgi:hypothetical protein
MYLIATSFRDVSVWELRESVGSYYLQMLWRLGKNELSMVGTNMRGASGLSTANLALVKQRGAIIESASENEE